MGWGTHDSFYCVEAAGWNKVCTSVDKQNHFFNIWDSKSQRFWNVPASGPLCCAANVRRSWFLSRDAATKNAERNFPNQKTLSKRQLTVQLQIFPEHFWTGCSLRMQKGDHGFFFFFFLKSRRGKEGTNSRRQLRTQQPLLAVKRVTVRPSGCFAWGNRGSHQHVQVLSSVLIQTCSVSHSNLHVCPLKGDCVIKKKRKKKVRVRK